MSPLIDQNELILEPFLQYKPNSIYNPITDITIHENDPLFDSIITSLKSSYLVVPDHHMNEMVEKQWLIGKNIDILPRYRLKIVNIEGNSHCNQHCYFCPVSKHPRPIHTMSMELYETIVEKVSHFRKTIQGVFMINYNEPTVDKYFLERIKILKKYELPVCINTNASGFNKSKADAILNMGGLRYLSVNLSTLNPERYNWERGSKHLEKVLKNIRYLSSIPIAEEMAIAVLGENDETHKKNFREIQEAFVGGYFETKFFEIMDRAGALDVGQSPEEPIKYLKGCGNLGSRPVQHLTVNAQGECVMCCEDYYEEYKVGDLRTQSVEEVLTGERICKIRAMLYGIEEAPEDFICRKCIFALSCPKKSG
ncbi:MAG: radical SAM protein [Saprospiraceae bacterium]|nr:radical SAM protein [Saprospiraceae bacterium]